MTHPSELISAYLDGELNGSEQQKLLTHLSGCGRCSVELEELQEVRSAVRSLPVIELPDGLIPRSRCGDHPAAAQPGPLGGYRRPRWLR